MTPDEMRDLLKRNPHWTTLVALEAITGRAPTQHQRNTAVNDSRTIAGLPDQWELWVKHWVDAYPCITPDYDVIASRLLVTAFGTTHSGFSQRHVVKGLNGHPEAGKWLEAQQFYPVHPVVELYREVLGREPDAPGLAFWMQVYKENDWRISDIRRAFERAKD